MAALTQFLQPLLGVAFPIGAFYAVKRRPAHTRAQLVVGATLGGGLGGAIIAAIAASGGAAFTDVLPWAVLGLLSGAIIGLVGVVAFALGRWLRDHP